MKKIVFIGRGGQGAKTAAVILAESAANQCLQIQAFPEYGPERMGAPVKSYVKISKKPIRSFSPILTPDYILLIDESLIKLAIPLLKKKTILIINSICESEKFSKKYNIKNKIIALDASKISTSTIGLNKPNLPLVGGLLKIEKSLDLKVLTKTVKEFFIKKGKTEVATKNVIAIKKAYKEVKL